jgi:hypothetical protein
MLTGVGIKRKDIKCYYILSQKMRHVWGMRKRFELEKYSEEHHKEPYSNQ